jgi:hypothetical protein
MSRGSSSDRFFVAVSPIEQVDRMHHFDSPAAFLDLVRDLEDAPDISRHDHLRARGFDMVQLALAQPLRHLGLRQVIRPRGPAANLRLLQG